MHKQVLLLTISALILAYGATAANAQGPMTQPDQHHPQQMTPGQEGMGPGGMMGRGMIGGMGGRMMGGGMMMGVCTKNLGSDVVVMQSTEESM
jgi:hypothetical protein